MFEEESVAEDSGTASPNPSLASILLGILIPALTFALIAIFVVAVRTGGGSEGDDLIPDGSREGAGGASQVVIIDVTPSVYFTPRPTETQRLAITRTPTITS